MLGDLVDDEKGKITAVRVLEPNGKAEVSFQSQGKLLGKDATTVATYTATPRPDGSLWGEGQAVVTTGDGQVATWHGTGIGKMTGKGMGAKWRGSLVYESLSPELSSKVSGLVGVFEYETDDSGNSHGKVWEWK